MRFAGVKILRQKFLLGNVHGAPDILFPALIVDKEHSDAANVADFTIGSHDALGGVKGRTFRYELLDQVGHGFAVLCVDTSQIFLNTRWFAGWIESVQPKYCGRPIEAAVAIEGR